MTWLRRRCPEPRDWNVEIPFTADDVFDALIQVYPERFRYCGRFFKRAIAIQDGIFRARVKTITDESQPVDSIAPK